MQREKGQVIRRLKGKTRMHLLSAENGKECLPSVDRVGKRDEGTDASRKIWNPADAQRRVHCSLLAARGSTFQ